MLCCSPGAIDGTFGAGTETAVKKFQTKYGLSQTGAVDTTTWDTLKSKILEVEQKLSSLNYSPGKVDGIATAGTGEALLKFQADNNLAQDGQIGPATRSALFGTTVEGGNDDFPLKEEVRVQMCYTSNRHYASWSSIQKVRMVCLVPDVKVQ